MAKHKKWTIEEDDFLKENFYKIGRETCSQKLNRTIFSIRQRAGILKIRNKQNFWTEEEDKFLKENYISQGNKFCANYLNRTEKSVQARSTKIKACSPKEDCLWKENETTFLKQNYETHGLIFCANHLNRAKHQVVAKASRLGLKLGSKLTKEKARILTEHYLRFGLDFCIENFSFAGFATEHQKKTFFDFLDFKIDTPQKAWVMGFIWADAHLHRSSNQISIEISEHDMEDIKENFYHLTPHWNFSNRKRNNSKIRQSCLKISNYFLREFLENHGFEEKSGGSHEKIIEAIPRSLQNFFWLGLMDGDGSIDLKKKTSLPRIMFWSNFDQKWDALENLLKELDFKYYISRNTRKNRPNQRWSVIGLTKGNETVSFLSYLYNNNIDSTIGLKRKFKKYQMIHNKRFDGPSKHILLRNVLTNEEFTFNNGYEASIFLQCDRGWLRKKCSKGAIFNGHICSFKNTHDSFPKCDSHQLLENSA